METSEGTSEESARKGVIVLCATISAAEVVCTYSVPVNWIMLYALSDVFVRIEKLEVGALVVDGFV